MYLINKALQESKEIRRQLLFQATEIRKKYDEITYKETIKVKNSFIENYNQFLNNNLTATLVKSKEKLLQLKNHFKEDLKNSLNELIKRKISENYSNYIDFLLNLIKKHSNDIDNQGEITFIFNSKDYSYFIKNFNQIQTIFKNSVIFQQSIDEFLGGFKVSLSQSIISYDYTFDTLINKNYIQIELEFSNTISDTEYKKLNVEAEEFFNKRKKDIEGYLKNYDQIK
ncbi:MAG: hypothetical protein ACFE9T_16395 [Promethearchaeota archaeon]